MSEYQSLSFSVKESVSFERGQEISELLSMSLDPDITIQEHENYISIRGALLLTGEYYPKEEREEEEDIYSLRDNTTARIVDQVSELEEGVYSLSHKFPIDITIPMNRVENLDDVYVMVESFDYELSERGGLQLTSELSISGIVGEKQRQDETKQVEEVEDFNVDHEVEKVPEPEFKVEREEEKVEDNDSNSFEDNKENDEFPSFELEARQEPVEEGTEGEGREIEEEARNQVEEEEVEGHQAPQIEMKSRYEETGWTPTVVTNEKQQEEVESKEEEDATEKYSNRDENALYLTNILSNGEEEFSKIRMRIIQQGESLDGIANYYDVPVTKLLQMNEMEDDHVQEGSIIYVPITANE